MAESRNESVNPESAGFTVEEAIHNVFKGSDRTKLCMQKNRTYTAVVNGIEISVNYKPAAKARGAYRTITEYGADYFDPEEASRNILSREEVIQREETLNPKFYNTDAYLYAEPELNEDVLTPLAGEEIIRRYAYFAELCNRAADDIVLEAAAAYAEKKKNGTLHKGKILRLAAFMAVSRQLTILELVAKAVSDTEMEIVIQERAFNRQEYEFIRNNPITELIAGNRRSCEPIRERATVKIRYRDERINGVPEIELPVIRLDDGRYGLEAEPLKALADFKCLRGNDKDGYLLENCGTFEDDTVWFQGMELPITCGNESDISSSLWRCLCEYSRFMKKKAPGKDDREWLMGALTQKSNIDERLFEEKYLNQKAFSEYAYEVFTAVDAVSEYLQNVDLQHIADTAPCYENSGKLVRRYWWYTLFDTADDTGIHDKVERRVEDTWEYVKSATFLFRKKPMIVPIVGWRGDIKNGFSVVRATTVPQVDWER